MAEAFNCSALNARLNGNQKKSLCSFSLTSICFHCRSPNSSDTIFPKQPFGCSSTYMCSLWLLCYKFMWNRFSVFILISPSDQLTCLCLWGVQPGLATWRQSMHRHVFRCWTPCVIFNIRLGLECRNTVQEIGTNRESKLQSLIQAQVL